MIILLNILILEPCPQSVSEFLSIVIWMLKKRKKQTKLTQISSSPLLLLQFTENWLVRPRYDLAVKKWLHIHFLSLTFCINCSSSKNVIFVSFIPFFVFGFWSLLATSNENSKILRNLCLHFARQNGRDGKKPERKSRN